MADNTEKDRVRIVLVDGQATILREIGTAELHQRDIAQTYRLIMDSGEAVDWMAINTAIMSRWSKSELIWIKELANSGRCFATA